MITVEKLTKSYGNKTVLKDLTFTVPDGQVTGFLGPNGAGKSTTMRCILGLDRPSSGSATINGNLSDGKSYIGEYGRLAHKSAIAGAVLDANWFTPGRSGRNHLKVVAQGTGIPLKRVDECLELVGMTEASKKRVDGYSLGMKQRLGLATALLGDPQHLIFDEPVNGLDPEGVHWVRTVIRDLAAQGKAVLVSSHLLSEMEQTADRLVVIGKGELIGEYSMEEFLAGGTSVSVECEQADALSTLLRNQGFEINGTTGNALSVGVGDHDEFEVRRAIAHLALQNHLLVTSLTTRKENLESRFLSATAQAQEYRSHMPVDTTSTPAQSIPLKNMENAR